MEKNPGKILRIPFLRVMGVIRLKKKEISAIYFFAILNGLLQLSIPLGIQAIINFLQAFTFSTSLWVLIILVLVGVLLKWCFASFAVETDRTDQSKIVFALRF